MRHTRIMVTHYGGPNALQVVDEDVPEPKSNEVRIKVLAAGVGMPDIMAREGIHPETPHVPYTPGWDLVGVVDKLGQGVSGLECGQRVVAMPIHGAYAEFVCLPPSELVPLPAGLDPAQAVSMVLNYITAYQMLHRSAHVQAGQRVLIHGASGGVGTALLQLGKLAELNMYGTCSSAHGAAAITELGATPINYKEQDIAAEIHRLTGEGVDVVFDPIGGQHTWRSRELLRRGGKVVGYGTTTTLRAEGLGAGRTGKRNRWYGVFNYVLYMLGGWLLSGHKHIIPYSIQTLKRVRPDWFRADLLTLLTMLQRQKITPVIAKRFALTQARAAHELLAKGGTVGKIVLIPQHVAQEIKAA